MTMKSTFLSILALTSLFAGCSQEIEIQQNTLGTDDVVKQINVTIENQTIHNEGNAETRTTLTKIDGKTQFVWSETDMIGIFPDEGNQVGFSMKDGAGQTTALFTGGGWGLKTSSQYAAYYPLIHDFDLDRTNIALDYTGQTQIGNGATTHLAEYDYMAAPNAVPSGGSVNFAFKHVGTLIHLKITMPKAGTYKKIYLETDGKFTTKGKLNLEDNTFTATETSSRLELTLNDIVLLNDNELLDAYMLIAPVDLSANTFTASVFDENNTKYEVTLAGKDFKGGDIWNYTRTAVDVLSRPLTFTALEDNSTIALNNEGGNAPNVEYSLDGINWTTWSYSAITLEKNQKVYMRGENTRFSVDGPGYMYSNFIMTGKIAASGNIMSLITIDEFANTTIIPNGSCFYRLFYNCTNLTKAPELPATTLAYCCYGQMFAGCTSLTEVPELPASTLATSCYIYMFYGCTSLTETPKLPATTLIGGCYNSMFYGCTSLTEAPELPATILASNCYENMFSGCTSLTTAPELPATTLASYCYAGMFQGCTNLIEAPELPATTLATSCYAYMFQDCTSLTTASELSATTLAKGCCYNMFQGCVSLTEAPELPATTLANGCYSQMFQDCTSLTTAPELPATTLAEECYYQMFKGCTSLVSAPELPATTLAELCYCEMFLGCRSLINASALRASTLAKDCCYNMFQGCVSLTEAPELPATTLATSCYSQMFKGCTSLVSAPELPATTLAALCYSGMFEDCTSLTTAPELPATTLAKNCYNSMFYGCTKLNTVKIAATDISADHCLYLWLPRHSSSTGTFYKNKNATWSNSEAYIPSGWTVIEYEP